MGARGPKCRGEKKGPSQVSKLVGAPAHFLLFSPGRCVLMLVWKSGELAGMQGGGWVGGIGNIGKNFLSASWSRTKWVGHRARGTSSLSAGAKPELT